MTSRLRRALIALATLGLLVAPAIPARAAVTCVTAGTDVNITMASGDAVTIARDPGGAFSVSGTSLTPTTCGGATVANRDTINVTGSGGNESVTIDLTEGPFEPGAVNEAGTTDEIEFVLNLGAGATDTVAILGQPGADTITVGESGINLNDADDVDVTGSGINVRTITGAGGGDALSSAGGNATGAVASFSVTINGGTGDDVVTGGSEADTLNGDADDDTIDGGAGSDTIAGGAGNDLVGEGSVANDADTIGGGGGSDRVSYGSRSADVVITLDGVADDGEAG
jgi:Ca2+-binding RTX toxin-like protein